MIRETPAATARPAPEEAIRAACVADHAWARMDGKDAAAFPEVSDAQLRLPRPPPRRHRLVGLGHRYLISELLVWLRAGDEDADKTERRQPDGNVESVGVVPGKKKRNSGKAVRLV